jgi:type IV pilus assembly protein PilB
LKAILRQDPDIILVGEMRDTETIDMSIRAALTGHLVFSTIHTNNSVATINRLADMGVEPFLISSTLTMIIAQRLVRTICGFCKEPLEPDQVPMEIPSSLVPAHSPLFHGKGCARCNHTGYSGRIGVFEVLNISPTLRDMIERKATTQEITRQAVKEGFRTLFDNALDKVKLGLITLEEAMKVSIGII